MDDVIRQTMSSEESIEPEEICCPKCADQLALIHLTPAEASTIEAAFDAAWAVYAKGTSQTALTAFWCLQ